MRTVYTQIISTFILAVGAGVQLAGTAAAVATFSWTTTVLAHSAAAFSIAQICMLILLQKYTDLGARKKVSVLALTLMIGASILLFVQLNNQKAWILFAATRGAAYSVLTHYINSVLVKHAPSKYAASAFGWRYAALCGGSLAAPALLGIGIPLNLLPISLIAGYLGVATLVCYGPQPGKQQVPPQRLRNILVLILQTPWIWICSFCAGVLGEAPFYMAVEIGINAGLNSGIAQTVLIAMLFGGFSLQPLIARRLDARAKIGQGFAHIGIALAVLSIILAIIANTVSSAFMPLALTAIAFLIGALTTSAASAGSVMVTAGYEVTKRPSAIALAMLLYFSGYWIGTRAMASAIEFAGAIGFAVVITATSLILAVCSRIAGKNYEDNRLMTT